jgi:hypothetical protein
MSAAATMALVVFKSLGDAKTRKPLLKEKAQYS